MTNRINKSPKRLLAWILDVKPGHCIFDGVGAVYLPPVDRTAAWDEADHSEGTGEEPVD